MTTQPSEQPKQLTAIQVLRQSLERPEMLDEFRKALPGHIKVEQFIRTVLTGVANARNSADLLAADRPSLYLACMRAAGDGLMLDGREAALVIYGGKVAYMPMAYGILKKVRNSGELSSISAQLIHEKDPFKYGVNVQGEYIEHTPEILKGLAERGPMIGVYAIAKTKDGGIYIEVMSKEQVMATKNAGRSGDKGPWSGPFESEMWKKAVLRRICKRLPMSTDLEQVIKAVDEEFEFNDKPQPTVPAPVTSSRLAAVVEAKSEPAPAAKAEVKAGPEDTPI